MPIRFLFQPCSKVQKKELGRLEPQHGRCDAALAYVSREIELALDVFRRLRVLPQFHFVVFTVFRDEAVMAPRLSSSCTQERITSAGTSVLWVQHLPCRCLELEGVREGSSVSHSNVVSDVEANVGTILGLVAQEEVWTQVSVDRR